MRTCSRVMLTMLVALVLAGCVDSRRGHEYDSSSDGRYRDSTSTTTEGAVRQGVREGVREGMSDRIGP